MHKLGVAAVCAVLLTLLGAFSHGGTQYYFSSSTGNDANNCTAALTPCRTIAKANSLTYPAGSVLNFLAGDTFNDATLTLTTGNAAAGTIIVKSYGPGSCNVIAGTFTGCAVIQVAGATAIGINVTNVNDVLIQNIRVLGGTTAALGFQTGAAVQYTNNTGSNAGVTITNVEAKDFSSGIYVNGTVSSVTVSNNWVHATSVTTTADNGIWLRFAVTNSVVQGNLVENMGGHAAGAAAGTSGNGILLADGVSGITDQFNVTRNNGANITTCGGPAGNWVYNSSNVVIQFNESYNNQPVPFVSGCDWDGFDLDSGVSNSVMQYNYSHGNYGAGYLAQQGTVGGNVWANNKIRYNISEGDSSVQNFGGVTFSGSPGTNANSAIYNNTIYQHSTTANSFSAAFCLQIFNTTTAIFANNICYSDNGNPFVDAFNTSAVLDGNDYFRTGTAPLFAWRFNGTDYTVFATYQSGSGEDVHGTTSNPSLTSVGTGGTCYSSGIPAGPQSCPSGYRLQTGSAMIGAGLKLLSAPYSIGSVGTRDYYGQTIPNGVGTGFDIGADGGSP